MARLFIAIKIVPDLRQGVARVQKDLQVFDLGIRWVAVENIHLTLRFLGEIKEERIQGIKDILTSVGQGHNGFDMELRHLGVFPTERNPRVIWVSCQEKTGTLARVYEELENGLVGMGLEKDDHPFSAHITIGRIKSRQNIDKLKNYLVSNKDVLIGAQRVNELVLFRSRLSPQGPTYTEEGNFPLVARGE